MIYRFRAECEKDLRLLYRLLYLSLKRITQTIRPPMPDVEVELETDLKIEDLRNIMQGIYDGHVMVETLATKEEYTGERRIPE